MLRKVRLIAELQQGCDDAVALLASVKVAFDAQASEDALGSLFGPEVKAFSEEVAAKAEEAAAMLAEAATQMKDGLDYIESQA